MQSALNLKAYAVNVASKFEIQTPLLWDFDPANPTATPKIIIDSSNTAPIANPAFTGIVNGITI